MFSEVAKVLLPMEPRPIQTDLSTRVRVNM